MLANILGMEIESWDPLKKIDVSPQLDLQKLKEVVGQLAVALGLGLR